jgi:methyl-accepting chemotaxis protein
LLNLDGLARRLRYIVGRLQRAADSIETVVGEVLRGTQMLSAGVLDEAKSVEETSRSIAEINASMHSVGDSLQTLLNLSQSTSGSVGSMATSINQVSENADELAQFVEETAKAIEERLQGPLIPAASWLLKPRRACQRSKPPSTRLPKPSLVLEKDQIRSAKLLE